MSGFGYNVNGFGSFPSRGPAPVAVQYAVIAGGGGGGYYMAGGGGAGGILTGTANIEIAVAQQITVGGGGSSTYGTDNYGYNGGSSVFGPIGTVTGTNTGTVAWGLSGGCIADDASINTAFGTNVVATAKAFSGKSNDMTVSAVSGAVTIANAAVDTQTYFQVMRDVSADTQSGYARLLGIKLFFTTDAANDA